MHNESKNIFKAARTPAVFFATAGYFTFCLEFLALLECIPWLIFVTWLWVQQC